MDAAIGLVVFGMAGQGYAVRVGDVVRVLAAAELTPLPGAPPIVLGILDLHGEILPVLDLRQRLGHAARALGLDDSFLVVRTARRTVALVVDDIRSVVAASALQSSAALDPAGAGHDLFTGVVRLDDGLVLIHDIEKFLRAHESAALEEALRSVV
ncbi:MAG: chemotaxis protein CheW [Pseudomonadota bacterium]